jgi:chromate reductase
MNQSQIAVVIGSIRRESYNRLLAGALKKLAPQEFTFNDLRIDDLPLYNQDLDGKQPEQVGRLKSAISSANGVIFVTPEYNRSIPGVLKNAIDHGSRPYGESAWMGKPAGVIGISPGSAGTCMAQQHLRNILAYLDMPTMGQPEVFLQFKEGFFDSNGDIADSRTKKFAQGWMDRYAAWVKSHAK